MKINVSKSMTLVVNSNANLAYIENIAVVDSIKYLGIKISGDKDCFKKHKEEKILCSKGLSNLTYSVISNSCNKVMIGKTYWKSVALTSILYGTAVLTWNKNELVELQREENKVWRFILGAPGYVSIAALRGELGASNMVMRDMKTKLKYVKCMEWRNRKLDRNYYKRYVQ